MKKSHVKKSQVHAETLRAANKSPKANAVSVPKTKPEKRRDV